MSELGLREEAWVTGCAAVIILSHLDSGLD